MDENAVAPAPAGEATPLNTNPEPTPPAAAEPTAEPAQPFSIEEAQAIKTFLDSNGGFEKVKKNLTARQADIQAQAQLQTPSPLNDAIAQQPSVTAQPQQAATQPIQGGMTQEEFAVQQYFTALASQEAYKGISDQMLSGEVLKEMAKFDIRPMINGVFNDRKVRDFLDLYAKSQPAPEPSTPVTNTPTVEYVQTGETITNLQEAMNVLAQDRQLKAQGLAGHPKAKEANEFFDGAMNTYQNRGKREHKTLDQSKQ